MAFLTVTSCNVSLFQLKLYFYREFLMIKGATASVRNCGRKSEQNVSQALHFKNSLFRIDQLVMLFSAQNVLY